MKPSDFETFPLASRAWKAEAERVALNIMQILARTGDTWRELPWDEYEKQRMADYASARDMNLERLWFWQVIEYTTSENAARRFSPAWAAVGQNESE